MCARSEPGWARTTWSSAALPPSVDVCESARGSSKPRAGDTCGRSDTTATWSECSMSRTRSPRQLLRDRTGSRHRRATTRGKAAATEIRRLGPVPAWTKTHLLVLRVEERSTASGRVALAVVICRNAGGSLPLWRRTAVRRRRPAVRTPGSHPRERHGLADFARRQPLHGLLQLESRAWPHVDVLRDGPIALEA
jgi:hypothetical protein